MGRDLENTIEKHDTPTVQHKTSSTIKVFLISVFLVFFFTYDYAHMPALEIVILYTYEKESIMGDPRSTINSLLIRIELTPMHSI